MRASRKQEKKPLSAISDSPLGRKKRVSCSLVMCSTASHAFNCQKKITSLCAISFLLSMMKAPSSVVKSVKQADEMPTREPRNPLLSMS